MHGSAAPRARQTDYALVVGGIRGEPEVHRSARSGCASPRRGRQAAAWTARAWSFGCGFDYLLPTAIWWTSGSLWPAARGAIRTAMASSTSKPASTVTWGIGDQVLVPIRAGGSPADCGEDGVRAAVGQVAERRRIRSAGFGTYRGGQERLEAGEALAAIGAEIGHHLLVPTAPIPLRQERGQLKPLAPCAPTLASVRSGAWPARRPVT